MSAADEKAIAQNLKNEADAVNQILVIRELPENMQENWNQFYEALGAFSEIKVEQFASSVDVMKQENARYRADLNKWRGIIYGYFHDVTGDITDKIEKAASANIGMIAGVAILALGALLLTRRN
jgi:hypothetical protein